MLTGFPFHDEWMSRNGAQRLFRAARWNQYLKNWPIILKALRALWDMGKVSELKSPYFEPLENLDKY